MVKCDLTHNIIVFLKRVKVNSFKEFFSKKQKDDDHMNNILEAMLQTKDKNIIWDNKVQEHIFKK